MTNSNSWYRKEYLLGLGGLGGGAGGILIAGGPIATSGDAYQIYKGLRYDKPDAPRLTRTTGTGDRRTFTIAAWIKQSALDYHTIFGYYGSGQFGGCRLMIDNTGSLRFQEREDNGNYTNCDIRTTALLRDYSAWMHIVCAVDTTQSTNTERVKIYLNGVRQTSFETSTWPAQHYALHINDSSLIAGVGSWYEDSTHYPSNAYLADVHFIDGLALSSGAFGTFSSGGVFNPKIFALPIPNQGVTHSSTLVPTINGSTASFNSGNGAAMAFNGTASDGVQNWANVLSTGALSSSTGFYPNTKFNTSAYSMSSPCFLPALTISSKPV